jgi:hypothetical protein
MVASGQGGINMAMVRAAKSEKGVELYLEHPLLEHVDADLLARCFEQILECAGRNGCFEGSVRLTHGCLETFANHNRESQCLSTCFGCYVETEQRDTSYQS